MSIARFEWAGRRVFVTGATGIVGSWLVKRLLDHGAHVVALVRDWEPSMALFSGDGGMWAIRALVPQAAEVLVAGGLLAMEVDSRRTDLAVAAVRDDGRFTDIETRLDLTGRPRFVVARRQER